MSVETTKKSYKDTLNLPQSTFAMEAKLVQSEPARLKRWQDAKLYDQVLAARAAAPKWVLHDGPPFANGDIHIGHLINKTLKDVIVRFRTMQGKQTPYVPGWDCHGLPIEHKIQEEIKKEGKNFREVSTLDMRKRCYAYADKYVKVQSEQFQRLGILGEWDKPYLTMTPDYEASTLEVFARFVEAGLVYKQLKPVPWSVANQTALADAELEYEDVTDPSVFVEFPATGKPHAFGKTNPSSFHLLVWTTTPWTLPANLAIAVNSQVDYALVSYRRDGVDRLGVAAADLVKTLFEGRAGIERYEVVDSVSGDALLGVEYTHPFVDRRGRVVEAEYVTTSDGTGLVHTAPGHGAEDYETGVREGLEIYSPVLANGRFDDTVPEFIRGKNTKEGNALITAKLKELNVLFAEAPIKHSYPHDWRSKTPIIFRATEQWFVAMEKAYHLPHEPTTYYRALRDRAVFAVADDESRESALSDHQEQLDGAREMFAGDVKMQATIDSIESNTAKILPNARVDFAHQVQFVPEWGRRRLEGMLDSRPDWCVSRQRAWGLPIPVFYNEQGEALLTGESVRAVARRFAEKGSDAWFTDSPADLLPGYDPGPKFPKDKLRKETDIFDVWFESGSSWHAVLQKRDYLQFPADLYLEGSDQHRGWFQLSLLPALGATGLPPFKQVLTHGFAVKPDGRKVSKSDKEYVTATQEVDRHGADVLRLWCSSVDYQTDIPTSPKVIQEFGDKYRKIRNTIRYLLSNLFDFNPATEAQEVPPSSLDGWALAELDTLIVEATAAYEAYQLHRVFRLLYDFCSVQISATYGNAMKDRLYCDAPNSLLRRRSQTVMHKIAVALVKLLAPICVFTADEAWEQITHKSPEDAGLSSVHLALLPKPSGDEPTEDQRQEWKQLMDLRSDALGQIDKLTRQIGKYKALDAEIIFKVDDDATRRKLQQYGVDLEDMVGCGYHSFAEKGIEGPAVVVEVLDRRDKYQSCARSWKRRPDVGADAEFPDLTLRDAAAVKARVG
jgi:isoleucyl-tRNA synthetase